MRKEGRGRLGGGARTLTRARGRCSRIASSSGRALASLVPQPLPSSFPRQAPLEPRKDPLYPQAHPGPPEAAFPFPLPPAGYIYPSRWTQAPEQGDNLRPSRPHPPAAGAAPPFAIDRRSKDKD
ncbi:hypothetical protein LEMLEM_LOCUS2697 [Lemmus lemmus]